jgi:hypothetical protein
MLTRRALFGAAALPVIAHPVVAALALPPALQIGVDHGLEPDFTVFTSGDYWWDTDPSPTLPPGFRLVWYGDDQPSRASLDAWSANLRAMMPQAAALTAQLRR